MRIRKATMSTQTLPQLHWRAAIKVYDTSKKLTAEQVALITEAARMSPTSYGMQPLKLFIVSDTATKKKLRKAGYNQPQFTDASHIFIFAARTAITKEDVSAYITRIATQRNIPETKLDGFREMLLGSSAGKTVEQLHSWAAKQAYITLGMTLAIAADHKIDTTPMEGFDAQKFDTILEIQKSGFTSVVALAAGFRSKNDPYLKMAKVRKTVEEFTVKIAEK